MMVIVGFNLIICPLLRQSFLLSSSTVFMFSIHTASTGPSKQIHFLSGVSDSAQSLISIASTPSDHSCESASKTPYSWFYVIDFGFTKYVRTFTNLGSSFIMLIACPRTLIIEDLPAYGSPTTMRPCLTIIVS